MRGDVITMVNETEIKHFRDLQKAINQHVPGDEVEVKYQRAGQEKAPARTASISRVVNHSIEEADGEGLRRYRLMKWMAEQDVPDHNHSGLLHSGVFRSEELVRWFRNVARDLPWREH